MTAKGQQPARAWPWAALLASAGLSVCAPPAGAAGVEAPSSPAPVVEPAAPEPASRFSSIKRLDRAEWPIVFDVPPVGITHREMAVLTERETGRRLYQSDFLSEAAPGQAGPCCMLQLWAEEGAVPAWHDAKPLAPLVAYDAGAVVRDHREGLEGRLDRPALRYVPFAGTFGGGPVGCFEYLGDTTARLPDGRTGPILYHGYFCRRGPEMPDARTVAAVMAHLRPRRE